MAISSAHVDGRIQDLKAIRRGFVRGEEEIRWFTHSNLWQAYWEAREAAKFFAGISPDEQTVPYVATMGPMVGRVVGSQTRGGLKGWRIDLTPKDRNKPQQLHLNWWDYSDDPEPERKRNRSLWWRGGNHVKGADEDMYLRIFEHFPNPLSSSV